MYISSKAKHFIPHTRFKSGFTLIELVMVILLLSILAAVAIPNFIDFRTDAKNAAVKGVLGALRSAISITRAAIALKESPNATPAYPTINEVWANTFNVSHPNLSGTNIVDPSSGFPKNPWTVSTYPAAYFNSVIRNTDCGFPNDGVWTNPRFWWQGNNCSLPSSGGGRGWVYAQTTGEIWAGSYQNGANPTWTGVYYWCDNVRIPAAPGWWTGGNYFRRANEDCY